MNASREENMKKKELKQFELEEKIDFLVYLQELIARTDKCLTKLKKYLDELEVEIMEFKDDFKNENKKKEFNYEVYARYVYLLESPTSYLLNLIGDQQKSSISYAKFRALIGKRIKRSSLKFKIRDIDEEIEYLLADLNRMRNWNNHVPESLLLSEISLIKEGKYSVHKINPIQINYFQSCEIDVVEDLFETSTSFYIVCRKIHQSMKKDYSSMLGESVKIQRIIIESPKNMKYFDATKLSADVQGIKGTLDEN